MKKLLFSIIFAYLSLFPGFANAEDENICPDRVKNLTYYGLGISSVNIDGLNSSLSPNGYNPIGLNFISLVTSGTRNISGKFVSGSENSLSLENKSISVNQNYKTYISSSANILLNVGYVIFSSGDFNVYPILGGGISNVTFDVIKNTNPPSFKDILKTPERGTTMNSFSLVGDLGIGADYLIKIGKSVPQKGGIVIGVKAGYVFTLFNFGFRIKGESVPDAPYVNNNGFYVRLIGGYTQGIIPALLDIF